MLFLTSFYSNAVCGCRNAVEAHSAAAENKNKSRQLQHVHCNVINFNQILVNFVLPVLNYKQTAASMQIARGQMP